jgi:GT2 family glycosyltransferase
MAAAQRNADAEGRGVILVVASALPEHLDRALRALQESPARNREKRYAVAHNDRLAVAQLGQHAADLRVQPHGARATVRWLRDLRKEGFETVVVLLTGTRSHRRLRLLGLTLAFPHGYVLDELGELQRCTPARLLRIIARRLVQQCARRLGRAPRALKILRREGFAGLRKRLAARTGQRGRVRAAVGLHNPLRRLARAEFPVAEAPEVSIIIPARDQWRFTHACLASIARHTSGASYEVILVDNASSDKTRHIERLARGLRVLRQKENRGFVEACNTGARAARGDKLVFLNNDVTVTPRWLESLLWATHTRPDWGAVGAKLLFPDGTLQEAGSIVWRDGTAWNYGRFDDAERPEYNYVRETDYCSAAALMVNRKAFEEVGGFDPAYSPGYWEDTDLCFALRAAGRTVLYQPLAALYHYEGASAGTNDAKGMKRFQRLNAERFRGKWTAELAGHPQMDPAALFRARDRRRGLTVLVFDHIVPRLDRDAGSSFMYWFLRSIAKLGHRVLFWPENLFRSPCYADVLQQEGIEVLYGPLAPQEYLQAHGRFIDIAIAHHPVVAGEYLPLARPFVSALGYIPADLEHLREQRRGVARGTEAGKVDALKAREARLVELADCIAIHSPVEQRILEDELGARNVVHLPLPVPPAPATATPFEEREGMLFVGSTHPPNVDAVEHFVRRVLPIVRARDPGARLWVVGDVCTAVAGLGSEPGVELLGYAPDLQPWFERARVFVAPLRYGAGIKGKILRAMSAGVPVVTTEIGAEGIGLENGISAFIEDADDAFAAAVLRLCSDRDAWLRMRLRSREMIEQELSFGHFERAVSDMLARLVECAERRGTVGPPGRNTPEGRLISGAESR